MLISKGNATLFHCLLGQSGTIILLFHVLNLGVTIMLITENGGGGAGSDLPKFKFSVQFPIGLHAILQLQMKKFKTA